MLLTRIEYPLACPRQGFLTTHWLICYTTLSFCPRYVALIRAENVSEGPGNGFDFCRVAGSGDNMVHNG
ncbi:hypothetical protein GCM10009414_02810 [Tatumella terrea]